MKLPVRRVVLASAGAGKTYLLSGVFLSLLAHGVDHRSILATTFTRKAAGEIVRRVIARALEGASDDGAAVQVDAQAGVEIGRAGWKRIALRLVTHAHQLRVQTIDAFLSTVARSGSDALRLDPGWAILDPIDEVDLEVQSVDRALREGDPDELFELLRALHAGDPKVGVRASIARVVRDASAPFWDAAGDPLPWHAIDATDGALDASALREASDVLSRLEPPITKAGAPDKRFLKALDQLRAAVADQNWTSFVKHALAQASVKEDGTFHRVTVDGALADGLRPLMLHARAMVTAEHRARTGAMYAFAARCELALQQLKALNGAYSFSDLPRLLGRLDDDEMLRLMDRLDERVQHLLLDEYQDTSSDQHRLFSPLIEEIASDAEERRSVLCVGDVKQSLYLWRAASPEILASLTGRMPGLEEERLDISWRSSPVVLEAVNEVMGRISTNPALSERAIAGARRFEGVWTQQRARHEEMPGLVTLEAVDVPEGEQSGPNRYERVAQIVSEIARRAPACSIGVLTRTRRGVIPLLLHALRRRGLDASEEGGNPLTDSPAVSAALSILRYAEHPGDTLALFHGATSALGPVLGIQDPLDVCAARACALDVRRRWVEDGPTRVLSSWYHACREAMTERDDARFSQLIELAARMQRESRVSSIDAFVARVENERVEAPARASIRVMTIHAAKGLEFDAVVMPDLERAWSIAGDGVLVQRDDPMEPPRIITRYPNELLRKQDPRLEEVYADSLARHVYGELCGLYVGMTRARRELRLVIDASENFGARRDRASSVLMGALAPGASGAGTHYERAAGGGGIVQEPDERGAAATTKTVTLRLRPGEEGRTSMLPRRSPSDQGGAVRASSLLRLERASAEEGTLVHACFERIGWLDDPGPPYDQEEMRRTLIDTHGCSAEGAQEAVQRVNAALASPEVAHALSRGRYGAGRRLELWQERAFVERVRLDGQDVLLRGRIDRAVLGFDADGAIAWCEVLDFKTESDLGVTVQEVCDRYGAQLASYRAAVVSMCRVPPERVRTTLVLVDRGEVVTVDQGAGAEGR